MQLTNLLLSLLTLLRALAPTLADDPARLVVRPDASTVAEGSPLAFFCRADGNPLPNVVWKVNGESPGVRYHTHSQQSGLSTLRLDVAGIDDNNTIISCSADNGVANAVVAEALLTVLRKEQLPPGFPSIEAHPALKSVEQGRTAHVSCRVKGDPRPKVLWLRDSLPLDVRADGRYSVSTIGNPGALMIQQAKEEDQGRYECVARNSLGVMHSRAAHLYVKVRRVPPYFSMKLNRTYLVGIGGDVNLTCVAVGYPMPRVFWKKSGDVVLDDPATAPIGKNVLRLSSVEATENFTCVAVSKLGNIETTTTVEVKALPMPPRNLRTMTVTAESVTLAWDPARGVEGLRGYLVKFRQKYSESSTYEERLLSVSETSLTISGLQPFQMYEFTVQSMAEVGAGPTSNPLDVQTDEAAPSSPPTTVQSRALSRDSILVQWAPSDRPNGIILGYKIFYTKSDPSTPYPMWQTHETTADVLMTTLYNLDVERRYYLRIQCRNSRGFSPMSQLVTVKTVYGLPAQPPSLKAKVLDARRVQLTWDRPSHSHAITGYVVRYNTSDGDNEFTLATPNEKHLTTGLKANTVYAFRVAAKSGRGTGEMSEPVMAKTLPTEPTGPPTLLSVNATSSHTLFVKWLPPDPFLQNGDLIAYHVRYQLADRVPTNEDSSSSDEVEPHLNSWQKTVVNSSLNEVEIKELRPFAVYEVTVAAATEAGVGPASVAKKARTHEDVPSAPRNFDVILANASVAKLTWEAPQFSNGQLGGYYVYVEKLNNGVPQRQHVRKAMVIQDKARTSTEIENLLPNTEYAFWMNAFNRHGDGEFTERKILLTEGIPPAPPEIQSVVLLGDEPPLKACVDWKLPQLAPLESPIDRYHIWFRPVDKIEWAKKVVAGTESTVELDGLWMGRVYEINLGAENKEGLSQNSTEKLETPVGLPDAEPLNVRYEVAGNKMRISWDSPSEDRRNGNITFYTAVLTPMDTSGDLHRRTLNVSERQASFTIDPRKSYTFKVAAATMKGAGPYSPVLTISPDPDALVGPPTNVRVQATTNTSVVVQWDFEAGQIDGFVVRYTQEPDLKAEERNKWVSRTVQSPGARHIEIGHLTAHKPYAFCVMAIKNNRQGVCSDPPVVISRLSPEYMVSRLEVQWKTSTSVKLRWDYHGPQPVGFYFNHTGKKEYLDQNMALKTMTTPGFKQDLEGTARDFLVTNLRPHMKYTLHVGVFSAANQRQYWPQEVVVMTDPTGPPFVEIPRIVTAAAEARGGQVAVRLQPSSEEYGPISHYWLIVVPGNFTSDDVVNLEPSTLTKWTEERKRAHATMISATPTKKMRRELDYDSSKKEGTILSRSRRELPATPYITAKIEAQQMQNIYKSDQSFLIGDEKVHHGFSNYPLEPNNKYRLMMRAFAKSASVAGATMSSKKPPMTETLQKLYSDSALSDPFTTSRAARALGKTNGMWLLGPIIALLIIALLIGMLVCWWMRCNKKSAGRNHRHGSITKVALSGNILNGGPGETSKLLSSDYSGQPVMNPYVQMNGSGLAESSVDLYPLPQSRSANYGPVPVPMPCLPMSNTNNGLLVPNQTAIPINELSAHIERLRFNNNAGFQQEFESIETGQAFTWEASNAEYNKHKNRYANVVAYDHSRVVLSNVDGILGSDYINANCIDGYDKPKAYIATQGPLPETFADFWRMVWEEGSATIVMLTNLEERSRVKCDQYWPTRGISTYGDVQVTLVETTALAHYTMRVLRIQMAGENEVREIRHLQYTAWPDHGVPDHPTPFLIFLKRVKTLNPPNAGPIISHCSAGIGRTGAFIVIDCMLERLRYENTVDIFGCVMNLRSQRSYMVQTEDQYVFIHDAVLDAVNSGSTEVPASKLRQHIAQIRTMEASGSSGIEMEFRHLTTLKWSNCRTAIANLPINRQKNRSATFVPFDNNRVVLRNIPGVDGSDYINASWVDGYKERGAYMVTQAPLDNTVFDFWRMVWEHDCAIIAMLCSTWELEGNSTEPYWPLENGTQYGHLVVEPIAEYNMEHYVLREFRISDVQSGLSRTVRHFELVDWPQDGVPRNCESFIDFIWQVHHTKAQFGVDGPIAVHCTTGAGRCGVFIALALLIDRIRLEHVVDVFTTVKLLRTERQGMVQERDQYEFLYQAMLEYLSSLS